jgi:transcriptional regulator with XRE-family HTH domain
MQAAKRIGPRIRALREKNGISLTALAQAAGRDSAALSRIEMGRAWVIRFYDLIRLADSLKVDVGDLFK